MKITVEFEFDETWNEYENTDRQLVMEDAIVELCDGVTYGILTPSINQK